MFSIMLVYSFYFCIYTTKFVISFVTNTRYDAAFLNKGLIYTAREFSSSFARN